jgi:uncharacterized membrane protein YgcG
MRRVRLWMFSMLSVLCMLSLSVAVADERILAYHSDIDIMEDGSMTVVETIRVRAEGQYIRRGIFRDFPTDYEDSLGNRFRLEFQVTGVTRDGIGEPFHTERIANGVRIYVGRSSVFLDPGDYTYRISYRTQRQLGFFEDYDELYWNVTGNGWDFPIDEASARVSLPRDVPMDAVRVAAYTGVVGSTARNAMTDVRDGKVFIVTSRGLPRRAGLTIAIAWPKGFVQEPTRIQTLRWMLRDNRGLLIALAGLATIFAFLYLSWSRVGRDPPSGVIFPHYQPPGEMSPAAARYIRRMGYDDRTFTAAIINLAVNGHLEISESGSDYTLTRVAKESAPTAPGEHVLLRKLFAKGDVVDLHKINHKVIGGAMQAHRRALRLNNHKIHFQLNSGRLVPAFLMFTVTVALVESTSGVTVLSGAVLGLAVILMVVFYHLLKSATPRGRALMDRLDGFRLYLKVAEQDALELRDAPRKTPELFEKYLPFALALDVEYSWAEQFADVFARVGPQDEYQPSWYHGDFNPDRLPKFTSNLGSAFTSAMGSAASAPGSSSGIGGGGFSGGGVGGGGGGGW